MKGQTLGQLLKRAQVVCLLTFMSGTMGEYPPNPKTWPDRSKKMFWRCRYAAELLHQSPTQPIRELAIVSTA